MYVFHACYVYVHVCYVHIYTCIHSYIHSDEAHAVDVVGACCIRTYIRTYAHTKRTWGILRTCMHAYIHTYIVMRRMLSMCGCMHVLKTEALPIASNKPQARHRTESAIKNQHANRKQDEPALQT